MVIFLGIVASLEIVGGFLGFLLAGNILQQITGLLSLGFGILTAGVSAMLAEIILIRHAAQLPQRVEARDAAIGANLERELSSLDPPRTGKKW